MERLRAAGGVIDRRTNRDIAGRLDRALRCGWIVAVLPGVYCLPAAADDLDLRITAAMLWAGPDAVLTRWAAARVSFWPTVTAPTVTVALPVTGLRSRSWLRFERRRIPAKLIWRRAGRAIAMPCLTAVDVASSRAGAICIDQVLRTRTGTLAQMWEALRLTPGRDGNTMRARLLKESRHEPWSEPERALHGLLDAAGIRSWVTNAPVLSYRVDVLFAASRLVIEVDGWEVHGTRQAFEADRRRRNDIVLAGYRVLNFTARQIRDDPGWVVATIRHALAC